MPSTTERETRILPASTKEVRAIVGDDGAQKLRGYGVVFNLLSEDLGGFREKVNPVAANRTLGLNNDVLCCQNHDNNMLLGRTGAKTLRIGADEVGVWYEVDLPDTTAGRDTFAQVERGDIAGSSFTFSLPVGGVRWSREGETRIREIMEFRLYELGPVVSPAYLDTTVAVRSLDALIEEERSANADNADNEDDDTSATATVNVAARRLRFAR